MNKRQTNKTKKYWKKGGVRNPLVSNINNDNGFTATLIKKPLTNQSQTKNPNLCKSIIKIGKNMTRKNFIPSQFPKLTGLTQKYAIKGEKTEQNIKSSEIKQKEKEEILEQARKDVKAILEKDKKQKMYEKAVLQAQKELLNK